MATLAKTAVTLVLRSTDSLTTSLGNQFHMRKEEMVVRRLKLTLTGQGGTANTITANALGFETLVDCSNVYDGVAGKIYGAAVDAENNIIVLTDPAGASTATDLSTTKAFITVYGTLQTKPSLT